MRAEVEVVLARVADARVNNSSSGNIVALADHIGPIVAEESHVMPLLNTDEGDARLIGSVLFQLETGISNCFHFVSQDKLELTLADAVTIHDNLNKILDKQYQTTFD